MGKKRRVKKMESALAKKYPNLKININYKDLVNQSEMPKREDDTIILNPNNSAHKKWFELEDGESN